MPLAAILGCAGPELSDAERSFFRAADPLGFIVFARNLVDPDQVRRLTADLRATIGRPDAPILVDQEGGRVARLKAPHWRHPPAADRFGAIAASDRARAAEALPDHAYALEAKVNGARMQSFEVVQPGGEGIGSGRTAASFPGVGCRILIFGVQASDDRRDRKPSTDRRPPAITPRPPAAAAGWPGSAPPDNPR